MGACAGKTAVAPVDPDKNDQIPQSAKKSNKVHPSPGDAPPAGPKAVGGPDAKKKTPKTGKQGGDSDLRAKILQNASKGKGAEEEEEDEVVEEVPMLDFDGLCQRQFEVESMLRWKLDDAASVAKSTKTVDDLLAFIAKVKKLSKKLGVSNHGLVFQELLGRGNTREGEAIITGLVDLSSVKKKEIAEMVANVNLLRELLRVKIQDGADVDTAAVTLRDCRSFFHSLSAHAEEKGKSPFEVFEELRAM